MSLPTPAQPGPTNANPLPRLPIGQSLDRSRDRQASALRKLLEGALVRTKGGINERDAVAVWAACRAFRRAQRIEKRLRDDAASLTVDQWLAMQTRATSLEEAVVRHVKALALPAHETNDALEVYCTPAPLRHAAAGAEALPTDGPMAPESSAGQLAQAMTGGLTPPDQVHHPEGG